MDVFVLLFTSLIPLYVLIALGWVGSRFCGIEHKTLAALALYVCMPAVAFGFVSRVEFQPIYASLPFITFFLFAFLNMIFYRIGLKAYKDNRANLLALCAANGNTGYFGLPIVFLLFDQQWAAVYIFTMLGVTVNEATVMYYLANRGHFNVRQSLINLLKFPTMYAIALALIVNFLGIELPDQFTRYWDYFNGAYVIIGMMIIGASLASSKHLALVPKFLMLTFLGKFLIWPALAYILIHLDRTVLGWFQAEIHQMIFLMAVVPPAANITAFAAQMDLRPDKAATTVLVGTVFALFFIPVVLVLSGLY